MCIRFINKGGKTPELQEKSITITSNGTTNVTPDTGYDGLNNVAVTTNVDTSGYNTKLNTTFASGKQYIAQNITELPVTLDFSNITNMNSAFSNMGNLTACPLLINTNRVTSTQNTFNNCSNLTTIPLFDTSKVNTMFQMFIGCFALTSVPQFNTSRVTNMQGMFNNCTSLETVPLLDTSNVTDFNSMFAWDNHLITVPIFDTSKASSRTSLSGMFANCSNLSNESLNNILVMCVNATSYTGTKTLAQIGLTSAQATICQGLSNYQDFLDAGWTTGY